MIDGNEIVGITNTVSNKTLTFDISGGSRGNSGERKKRNLQSIIGKLFFFTSWISIRINIRVMGNIFFFTFNEIGKKSTF